jgi:hypothetical protein
LIGREKEIAAVADLGSQLDGDTLRSAWQQGAAMSKEQAIQYALDENGPGAG